MKIPTTISDRLNLDDRPTHEEVESLIQTAPWQLDVEYLEFVSKYDGFDGEVGSDFLSLWKVKDVIAVYPYYPDVAAARDLFFFGSDGASYGFAFVRNSNEVVGIDFLEIGIEPPRHLSRGFLEFLIESAEA